MYKTQDCISTTSSHDSFLSIRCRLDLGRSTQPARFLDRSEEIMSLRTPTILISVWLRLIGGGGPGRTGDNESLERADSLPTLGKLE